MVQRIDPAKIYRLGRHSDEIYRQVQLANAMTATSSHELLSQGMVYNQNGEYEKANAYLKEALTKSDQETMEKNEGQLFLARYHSTTANIQRELGHEKEAIELFLQARKECASVIPPSDESAEAQYDVERNLGITYLKLKQHTDAADAFQKAVDLAKQLKSLALEAPARSYRGLALVADSKVEEGFKELKAARTRFQHRTNNDWASHLGHMAISYERTNQLEKALEEHKDALDLREQIIDPAKTGPVYYHSRLGDSNLGIGKIYLRLEKKAEAKTYLDAALGHYKEIKDETKENEVRALLMKVGPAVSLTALPNALGFANAPASGNDAAPPTNASALTIAPH